MAGLTKTHTQAEWSLENLTINEDSLCDVGCKYTHWSCFDLEIAQAEIDIQVRQKVRVRQDK